MKERKWTVSAKLFTNVSSVGKHFIQSIFKRFIGHASSNKIVVYCLYLKKKKIKNELDNEATCVL